MADVPTTAWSETIPANTEALSLGASRIRELKTQIRELFAVDHEMESSSQDTDWGMHNIIRFIEQAADPDADSDHAQMYQKDVSGVLELFIEDAVGNVIQLTDGGVLALDAVTTDDDETITGAKTFQNDITMEVGKLLSVPYSTGTVSATATSTTVTGSGTDFSTYAKAGMFIRFGSDNVYYEISSVSSGTVLVLTSAYAGTTASGKSYAIYSGFDDLCPELHRQMSTLDHPAGCVTSEKLGGQSVTSDKLDSTMLLASVKFGSYTGDGGATQAITSTGIDLTTGSWEIFIQAQTGSDWGWWIKNSEDTAAYSMRYGSGGQEYREDYIVSGDSDGFTVANKDHINDSGITYAYRIIKNV